MKLKTNTSNENLEEFTNQIIYKINLSLNKFSYNVIVANLHEIYNYFIKLVGNEKNYSNLLDNYKKILTVIMPVLPHLASECLQEIGSNQELLWPRVDKKYLIEKKLSIVIQINGKKRSLITTEKSLDEKELLKKVNESQELKKFMLNKEIIKSIFIKDKLINLIIK